MSNEISLLVFIGVITFIFAMRTTEAPFAFSFYTATTAICFAGAVKLILTN